MEKIRNDYFDNIKSVLITLVVIGHFLLPLESTRLKDGLVNVIYLFHMPMFIMVSGYFAKGMYAGKRFDGNASESFYGSICFFRSYQG